VKNLLLLLGCVRFSVKNNALILNHIIINRCQVLILLVFWRS